MERHRFTNYPIPIIYLNLLSCSFRPDTFEFDVVEVLLLELALIIIIFISCIPLIAGD